MPTTATISLELDAFVRQAARRASDLVMGNRFAGGIKPGAMPLLHRYLGNPVLSFLGRLFFGIPLRRLPLRPARLPARRDPVARPARRRGWSSRCEMIVKAALRRLRDRRGADDAVARRPRSAAASAHAGATAGAVCASTCCCVRAGCSCIPASLLAVFGGARLDGADDHRCCDRRHCLRASFVDPDRCDDQYRRAVRAVLGVCPDHRGACRPPAASIRRSTHFAAC